MHSCPKIWSLAAPLRSFGPSTGGTACPFRILLTTVPSGKQPAPDVATITAGPEASC